MSTSIVCLFFLLASGLSSAVSDDGVYFGTQALLLTDKDPIPKKCVYNTVYKMVQAICVDLSFVKIPPSLRKDTQILDFSGNRLRDLKNETLSSFTSLSYVYLTDNFITNIEDAAFVNLRSLQVLDLTTNGLSNIPKNIFSLPVIKKLYLSDNKIGDSVMDPALFAEESSLEFLDISKNQLTKLPQLVGVLPYLKHLNVSGNSITALKTEDIAAFCSLKELDLTHNPITLTDSCECQALNAWVSAQKIKMHPPKFNCTNERRGEMITSSCIHQNVNDLVSNETIRIFEKCKNVLKIQEQTVKARSTWIVVVSCVATFLICLFIILYCIHRRNKKKKSVNVKRDLVTNHADDELLKGNNVTERVE